jgi:hypothetical protein
VAGFVAALLTIAVPWLIGRLHLPVLIFTGSFIGDIFGIVIAVYFWIFLGERSIWRSAGFVLASAVAYQVAVTTTIWSGWFVPDTHGGPWASTGTDVSVGGFLIGGAVGAFIVFLAALLFFPRQRLSRVSLIALQGSAAGAILGALGWAAGPSLGNPIVDVLGKTPNSYTNAQAACSYSLYLVWQSGIGLAIGWLFSSQPVEAQAGFAPTPGVPGSSQTARIARIIGFAAVALICGVTAFREFPGNYQSVQWQRAYKKHVAERPPMPNPPAEQPSTENPLVELPAKPSLENLPVVPSVAPDRMLILHSFGAYVPGGVSPQPVPVAPAFTIYSARYAIPGATTTATTGPVVWLQVEEYPDAAWAIYEGLQRARHPDFVGSTKTVKFGSQIYARPEAAGGQHGSYSWRSDNRLIGLSFWSAEPEGILKAYLQKFPSSETRATENLPNASAGHPSLKDLRDVPLLSPKQMLILHPLGEYLSDNVSSRKTVARLSPWEHNAFPPLNPNTPATQRYSVKYAVPATNLARWQFSAMVEVSVEEYPNAAWARYGVFQHAPGLASAKAVTAVKFGSRIYGGATDAAQGQNGSYTWTSENRLITVSFSSAEPDEILKAYLEKYPTSEKTTADEIAEAQAPQPEQQMLVLHQFGAYVPSRPYSGTTVQPPLAKYYSVRYALPGAPTQGNTGPTVDVQVYGYSNAAWAKYQIFEQGGITNFNPARPVKFGHRIYGGANAAPNRQNETYTTGQNGEYVWASENRLIVMRFYSSEPDDVLKAYLEKFPPSSADSPQS